MQIPRPTSRSIKSISLGLRPRNLVLGNSQDDSTPKFENTRIMKRPYRKVIKSSYFRSNLLRIIAQFTHFPSYVRDLVFMGRVYSIGPKTEKM